MTRALALVIFLASAVVIPESAGTQRPALLVWKDGRHFLEVKSYDVFKRPRP